MICYIKYILCKIKINFLLVTTCVIKIIISFLVNFEHPDAQISRTSKIMCGKKISNCS